MTLGPQEASEPLEQLGCITNRDPVGETWKARVSLHPSNPLANLAQVVHRLGIDGSIEKR